MSDAILRRPAPPADHRLAYGPAPVQFADLRLPPGPGPHPGLVVIHGGFWRARYDLLHIGHLCHALTAAVIVTFNVEYRRLGDPGGGWPGTFHDLIRATNAFLDIAPHCNVDPARVGVLGHSAGGHLACWLASFAPGRKGDTFPALHRPPAVAISLAGVLDLRQAATLRLSHDAAARLLGGAPDDVPARYAAASPLALLPAATPRLLIHGDRDDVVPPAFSAAYGRAAARVGDRAVDLVTLPTAGHFDLIDPTSPTWPAIENAIRQVLDIHPNV